MPQSRYFADLEQSPELGRQALRGGVALVASTYGSAVLQIIAAIILARLLAPEDYGLVAIVTVLTSFAPFLIDFGLGDAITQRQKITSRQVSSLFWISSGIGLAIAVIFALCSPFIVWVFHEPRLEPIVLLSATTLLLSGIAGQHLSLLRRTMQFSVVSRIQILGTLAGLAAAIPMAMAGSGYWALAFRPIVSAACVIVEAWRACPWRPGPPAFDDEVMSMVRFGMHVVGFSVVAAAARAVDRAALGLFYRPHDVGIYYNALILYENSILGMLGQIHSIGSTALSKLQSNPADLRQKYETALSTLAFFVMPAAAILSVTAQDIVHLLLGEKWYASGVLLSIIALRGIFQVIQNSQGWLHLSTGRPDRWKNWGIITAIVQTVAVAAGLPFGPTGVAVAFVAAGWVIALPSIGYAGAPIGIGMISVIQAVGRQLIGALITAATGWGLLVFFLADVPEIVRVLLLASFCSTIYLSIVVGLLRLTEPLRIAGPLIRDQLSRRKR